MKEHDNTLRTLIFICACPQSIIGQFLKNAAESEGGISSAEPEYLGHTGREFP